jgi:hypothetical protein
VNRSDRSQAVVISWGHAFHREPSGTWHQLDLIELASDPEWVRSALAWLGSTDATLALGVGLSILGWGLLPTLSSRWVAQVCTLFVVGLLYVVGEWFLGLLFFGLPALWLHVGWAAVTVGAIVLARSATPGRSAPPAPPRGTGPDRGFDPPTGAR